MMVEIRRKKIKWRWCWAGRSSECFRRDGGPTATNQPCWQSGELLIIPFIPHKILALCFKELITCWIIHHNQGGTKRWGAICLGKASEAYMRHRANFNDGQFDNGFASTTAYAVTPQQAAWENILYRYIYDKHCFIFLFVNVSQIYESSQESRYIDMAFCPYSAPSPH